LPGARKPIATAELWIPERDRVEPERISTQSRGPWTSRARFPGWLDDRLPNPGVCAASRVFSAPTSADPTPITQIWIPRAARQSWQHRCC